MLTPCKELVEDILFIILICICLILKGTWKYKYTEEITKNLGCNEKSVSEINVLGMLLVH